MIKILTIAAMSGALIAAYIPKKHKKYINNHKNTAQILHSLSGVPASVQIAQAIYESGGGQSNIAQKSNNHFGIRCGDGWEGQRYYSASGCWRSYDSVFNSYWDHMKFLQKYYPNACYKPWHYWAGLEGYGGPGYWAKIGRIIKKYKLYELDN